MSDKSSLHSGQPAKRQSRYRVYFWLMDVSLAAVAFLFVMIFLNATGLVDLNAMPGAVNGWIGLMLGLLISILPFILVFAKCMRDEYAELLFRRTMLTLAYLMVLAPFVYYVVAWTNFFVTGQPEDPPTWLAWASVDTKWGRAIWFFWNIYLVAFIVVFQALRWKDSR